MATPTGSPWTVTRRPPSPAADAQTTTGCSACPQPLARTARRASGGVCHGLKVDTPEPRVGVCLPTRRAPTDRAVRYSTALLDGADEAHGGGREVGHLVQLLQLVEAVQLVELVRAGRRPSASAALCSAGRSLTASESSIATGFSFPVSGVAAALADGTARPVTPTARPTAAAIRRVEIMPSATATGRPRTRPAPRPSPGRRIGPAALAVAAVTEEARRRGPQRPAPRRAVAFAVVHKEVHHGHCGKSRLRHRSAAPGHRRPDASAALLSLYADDAEMRVVDRNTQPSHPKVMHGREQIARCSTTSTAGT